MDCPSESRRKAIRFVSKFVEIELRIAFKVELTLVENLSCF